MEDIKKNTEEKYKEAWEMLTEKGFPLSERMKIRPQQKKMLGGGLVNARIWP